MKFELLILTCLILPKITSAEEECLKKKIWCYDCSTETNPKCGDPFNISLVRGEDKDVTLTQCEGCCIKIVKKKDTPQQIIQRTCTGKIQINLFMVDHVCMEESDGKGHMCFCESDACNSTFKIQVNPLYLGLVLLIHISSHLFS
ncbi:protein quiver [Tetranychus urticae]|uniref:protein quiver n=1 Tax=Tetranychus urticae TaxID=32264 RepID=UPI00077BF729|nr:protein quiver [Tetranychus urticae]